MTSATMYSANDSARVLTIPRRPPSPYMIVMVSMNTLSAREPDQSARTKPSDTTSKRPPSSTSFNVGAMSWSTVDGVSAWDARCRIRSLNTSTFATS
jgi:hypothetical protein